MRSRSTSRRCRSLRCRGRSRCRDSIRPAPDAAQRRFPSRFPPWLAHLSPLIHFLGMLLVAGVVRQNLGPDPVQTTVRHWAERGKSDPMSRILCIVPSLPERRPCSRLDTESVAVSLDLPGSTPEFSTNCSSVNRAHRGSRVVHQLSTARASRSPCCHRLAQPWSARNEACNSGNGRVVGSQQKGDVDKWTANVDNRGDLGTTLRTSPVLTGMTRG